MKFLFLVLGFFILGCKSSQEPMAPTAQSRALDEMVTQRSFLIESDWAYPLATYSLNKVLNSGLLPAGNTGSNINLIGNPNHFKVFGDSISIYLPYYGERRLSGGFNTDVGIEYNGIPDDFQIKKDEKRNRYVINFFIKDTEESYKVNVTLYPNWNSSITINSSHRTSISYRGKVSKLKDNRNTITNR